MAVREFYEEVQRLIDEAKNTQSDFIFDIHAYFLWQINDRLRINNEFLRRLNASNNN